MPGHRSPDGTVMVRGGQPTHGEDDSKIAKIIIAFAFFFVVITFPISVWFCFKVVNEYERAVIFRLGRLKHGGARGPGLFFVLPYVDNFRRIGLRAGCYDIDEQLIMTKDSVTVRVDAIVLFQVFNPLAAVCNNKNFKHSTLTLARTMLRTVLGTISLAEMLSEREEIARQLTADLERATDKWGIHVLRVEIKDVCLAREMQRVMAAEAEATRDARAKVIHSEGERKAAKALTEAALLLEQNPACLPLRYLQEMTSIASEKNSTIVFPLPLSMLKGFQEQQQCPDLQLKKRAISKIA